MTTKNIQDVVAERIEEFFELQEKNTYLVREGKIDPDRADELERDFLTQLMKEVEAGERERIIKITTASRDAFMMPATEQRWLWAITPPTSDEDKVYGVVIGKE